MRNVAKLERYPGNPILCGRGNPRQWDGKGAFNAAAILADDGRVHLLFRAEGGEPRWEGSPFWLGTIGHAVSADGFHIDERSAEPVLTLDGEDPRLGKIDGVEDPRIVRLGDTYYIVYAVSSTVWDRLALASTRDFKTFVKHGLIVDEIAQRTGALFPEKIAGRYWLLHRPIPNLWISSSSDLKHWGDSRLLLRNDRFPWLYNKCGVCGSPIRTSRAWAVIFHGKDLAGTYRLGLMWLDLEDPSRLLFVQPEPILEPEADYETTRGITGNCVYSCGQVIKDGRLIVYYGAADSTLCAATMPAELLELPDF